MIAGTAKTTGTGEMALSSSAYRICPAVPVLFCESNRSPRPADLLAGSWSALQSSLSKRDKRDRGTEGDKECGLLGFGCPVAVPSRPLWLRQHDAHSSLREPLQLKIPTGGLPPHGPEVTQ